MQKARGQAGLRQRPPTACRHGVSGSVSSPDRGSSHRSVALLGSLSVVIEYLALRDGPRRIQAGFHVPDPTWVPDRRIVASPTGLSPALVPFSKGLRLASISFHGSGPATPGGVPPGLGWSPFARRY